MVGAVEGRKPLSQRKVRERVEHTGDHTKKILPGGQVLGKQEGLIFLSFCNQQGLKPGVRKVRGLG